MTRCLVTLLPLMMLGCADTADRPAQQAPPSLAVVPPNYYYHYRYSARLHRRVREVIAAEDLQPVESDRALRIASDRLHQMRRDLAEPPMLGR